MEAYFLFWSKWMLVFGRKGKYCWNICPHNSCPSLSNVAQILAHWIKFHRQKCFILPKKWDWSGGVFHFLCPLGPISSICLHCWTTFVGKLNGWALLVSIAIPLFARSDKQSALSRSEIFWCFCCGWQNQIFNKILQVLHWVGESCICSICKNNLHNSCHKKGGQDLYSYLNVFLYLYILKCSSVKQVLSE